MVLANSKAGKGRVCYEHLVVWLYEMFSRCMNSEHLTHRQRCIKDAQVNDMEPTPHHQTLRLIPLPRRSGWMDEFYSKIIVDRLEHSVRIGACETDLRDDIKTPFETVGQVPEQDKLASTATWQIKSGHGCVEAVPNGHGHRLHRLVALGESNSPADQEFRS